MTPSAAARAAAERWRLPVRMTPRGGLAGDRLGRGTGASMEFHDRRPYQAGDDVRHVDWRAMARTDEAFVRVHREEVAPRLDLLVDTSASMALDPDKAQRTVDLASFLAFAGRAAGYGVRVLALGTSAERIELDRLEGDGLVLSADRPLPDVLPEALPQTRPLSLRILLSDFLVPHDPDALLRGLAHGAGHVACIQLLSRDDAEPDPVGAVRLSDAERPQTVNLVQDRAAVERYRLRLERLTAGLAEACQRAGGMLLQTRSDQGLDDALESMARRGLLE